MEDEYRNELVAGCPEAGDDALYRQAVAFACAKGAIGSWFHALDKGRLREVVTDVLTARPILGICLGLQISLEFSEENDQTTLGFLPGKVCRFQLRNRDLKIPHMGWNEIEVQRRHPLLEGINDGDEFYFVHSFFPEPENPTTIWIIFSELNFTQKRVVAWG